MKKKKITYLDSGRKKSSDAVEETGKESEKQITIPYIPIHPTNSLVHSLIDSLPLRFFLCRQIVESLGLCSKSGSTVKIDSESGQEGRTVEDSAGGVAKE